MRKITKSRPWPIWWQRSTTQGKLYELITRLISPCPKALSWLRTNSSIGGTLDLPQLAVENQAFLLFHKVRMKAECEVHLMLSAEELSCNRFHIVYVVYMHTHKTWRWQIVYSWQNGQTCFYIWYDGPYKWTNTLHGSVWHVFLTSQFLTVFKYIQSCTHTVCNSRQLRNLTILHKQLTKLKTK